MQLRSDKSPFLVGRRGGLERESKEGRTEGSEEDDT